MALAFATVIIAQTMKIVAHHSLFLTLFCLGKSLVALVFATVIIAQTMKIVAHSRVVDTPIVGVNVEIIKKKGYALHKTQKPMLFGQVEAIVEHAVVITRNWFVKLAVTHGLITTIQRNQYL